MSTSSPPFTSWTHKQKKINSYTNEGIKVQLLSFGKKCYSHLCHDLVLTFLHILPISFHNGLQELEILDVSSVCFNAVDEMMDHAVADLIAQQVVVHEDVTHRLSFKQLVKTRVKIQCFRGGTSSYIDSFV